MVKDRITPEEKLLRVIEDPSGAGATFARKKARFSLPSIKQFRKKIKLDFKRFNLKIANKILIGAGILLTIFLIGDFINLEAYLEKRLEEVKSLGNIPEYKSGETSSLSVSLEKALDLSKKRSIFTFITPLQEEEEEPPQPPPIIERLKLVGVIWAENPQVMIEDTQGQRTYLLSTGDKIADLVVKEILIDSVILESEDGEWELR
jgi:type II secretory pathway component PulC